MQNYILTFLFVGSLLFYSCKKKDNNSMFLKEDNKLSIKFAGKERLSGVVPKCEGVKDAFHFSEAGEEKVFADTSHLEETFTFSSEENKTIDVVAKQFTDKNIVGLFVSPNGSQSTNGEDFIGLFFDSIPSYKVGTAYHRYGQWRSWTKPMQIKNPGEIEKDENQFFIWQYEDGVYGAAMPLGGEGYRSTIGSEESKVGVKAVSYFNGMSPQRVPVLALGFNKDPYQLISDLYEKGMALMGKTENLRKNKKYPEIFEKVGWCTWNALGANVSEESILSSLKTFTNSKFPVPNLIIDDGWLNVGNDEKLKSFTPDTRRFPNGFGPVINNLKEHGVENVGVWHALNAYWAGVDINSELGQKYGKILLPYVPEKWRQKDTVLPEKFFAPTPASVAGFQFYDDWYSYLKSEGVSFLKVDNQLIMERVAHNNLPIWNAAERGQKNFQSAIKKYFDGTVINCMDMTNEAYYNFDGSAVARAVEDYFPEERSYHMQKGNAAVHVLCAVANSLYFSEMVWPDYDMFQSHNPDGAYHAIARAISGGPIYLTETPGQQKFDVLWPLIYKDGTIIRTDVPAKPTEDCLFQVQDPKPYKAFSFSGEAGILGVWNVADADLVSGEFSASDVYGIKGDNFYVYEYFSKTGKVVSKKEKLPINLGRMGYQLYYIVPIKNNVALLGLTNKYNGPKTIKSFEVSAGEVLVEVSEGGIFGAYLPSSPKGIEVDGIAQENNFTYTGGLLLLNMPNKENVEDLKIKISF